MQPGGSEPTLMPNQTLHLFQPKKKYGVTWYGFNPTFSIRWTLIFILELSNICFFNYAEFVCYLSSEFAFGSLRDRLTLIFFLGGEAICPKYDISDEPEANSVDNAVRSFGLNLNFRNLFFLLCPLYHPIWYGVMSPLFVATICGDELEIPMHGNVVWIWCSAKKRGLE